MAWTVADPRCFGHRTRAPVSDLPAFGSHVRPLVDGSAAPRQGRHLQDPREAREAYERTRGLDAPLRRGALLDRAAKHSQRRARDPVLWHGARGALGRSRACFRTLARAIRGSDWLAGGRRAQARPTGRAGPAGAGRPGFLAASWIARPPGYHSGGRQLLLNR